MSKRPHRRLALEQKWPALHECPVRTITPLGTGVALFLNHAADGTLLESQAKVVIPAAVLLISVASLLAPLGPARQGLRIEPTEALGDPSR